MVVVLDNGAGSAKVGYSTDTEPRFVVSGLSTNTLDIHLSDKFRTMHIFSFFMVLKSIEVIILRVFDQLFNGN